MGGKKDHVIKAVELNLFKTNTLNKSTLRILADVIIYLWKEEMENFFYWGDKKYVLNKIET